MIGTIISILIAGFWWFLDPELTEYSLNWISGTIALFSLTLFSLENILSALFWAPLQKMELKLTPHVLSSLTSDWKVKAGKIYFRIFLLLSLALSVVLFVNLPVPIPLFIALWIVFFGISLDVFYKGVSNRFYYLNPYNVVDHYKENAGRAIRNDREDRFLLWNDALAETALKAIDRHSPSLSREALNRMHLVARDYFLSLKSIAHTEIDEESSSAANYTLLYLMQRFDMVNKQAIKESLEEVSSDLVGSLGRVTLDAAHYDMTMASLPIHFLGKCSLAVQKAGFEDATQRAIFTFVQVSRMLIEEVDIKYLDLKEPFLSIIGHMHELASASFRKNREINISFLIQPFEELREVFDQDKVKDHPDRNLILSSIDNVIGEFKALESMMTTMPNFSENKEEEELQESEETAAQDERGGESDDEEQ
ncbi:MAG: hypothetical protein WD595_00190 [Waddliaceae bacterium]